MKVMVLGAGVVGVTTAYYLARAGADVTVIERQSGPALETSFANAGQVSPGYSTPWGAPGIALKSLKWMLQRHAPLAIRPDGTLQQLRWLAAMWHNCAASRYEVNKERMLRLSEYSRDCLAQLRRDTGIAYEGRTQGTLQLFRTPEQVAQAERDMRVLRTYGIAHELLDAAGVVRAEPALAQADAPIAGGLRLPGDETGDCYLFTTALARLAEELGVRFRFGTQAQRLLLNGQGAVTGAVLDGGECMQSDCVVLALGSYSRELLLPLGLDIPLYPVKGYSLTLPIVDAARAPVSTVLDETYKIAITRFEQRIRVGGMAELAGFDCSLRLARRETLEMVTRQLFPGGDFSRGAFWAGLRPMTPDSTPIVGVTPRAGLLLNTGHGTLGWTMACGSGQLVADLALGRPPAIRTDGLAVSRYQRARRRSAAPSAAIPPAHSHGR